MLPEELPFHHDEFDMPMNVRPIAAERIVQVDERYLAEVAQRRALLAADQSYYCAALAGTEAMQWEALTLVLPLLAHRYSDRFSLTTDGDHWHWHNRLLEVSGVITIGKAHTLPAPSGAASPMDGAGDRCAVLAWLGTQLQEDLILIDGSKEGAPLVAGVLCFAAGWCLGDKLGKSFLAVHREVPQFSERLGRQTDALIARLRGGRPVGRTNWSVAATDRLNLAPVTWPEWLSLRRGITRENAGERLWLRMEWQTLSRLPSSGAILFTIRTTLMPIAALSEAPTQLQHFTNMLKGMPRAVREYKGLTGYGESLIGFLEARCRELDGRPPTTARHLPLDAPVAPATVLAAEAAASQAKGEISWEPWPLEAHEVLEGVPAPRVRWLHRGDGEQPFHRSGLLEIQPSCLRRVVLVRETFHLLSGRLELTIDDGELVSLTAGDSYTQTPDHLTTWRISEPIRVFFVFST